MNTPTTERRGRALRSRLAILRHHGVMAGQRARPAVHVARHQTTALLRRWPATVSRTRTGALRVASAIRALPRLTVETLTAGSLGFGAGLYLRRAPRLVKVIGVAPALALGASMLRSGGRDSDGNPEGVPHQA